MTKYYGTLKDIVCYNKYGDMTLMSVSDDGEASLCSYNSLIDEICESKKHDKGELSDDRLCYEKY